MSEILVAVKDLKKTFLRKKKFFGKISEHLQAVDEISFEIKRGQILGLVGESGCGKTTCGKLMVRLYEATGGRVIIEGKNIETLKGKELKKFRKKVQMIFQDPYESLNPRLTVMDTIIEPLVVQNMGDILQREKKVFAMLTTVELTPPEDFAFRYPHQLSGGQRQRVAIARALIVEPVFIVADEPVSMLDTSIRAGIMNLLLGLKEKFNLTYLFITHDLAVARYMCDEIVVMYLGKIVEKASTEEIINNPQHPYTKALLSAVPLPDPESKKLQVEIKGGITTLVDFPCGCRFAPRCPKMKNFCLQTSPQLKEITLGHMVSCHLI